MNRLQIRREERRRRMMEIEARSRGELMLIRRRNDAIAARDAAAEQCGLRLECVGLGDSFDGDGRLRRIAGLGTQPDSDGFSYVEFNHVGHGVSMAA